MKKRSLKPLWLILIIMASLVLFTVVLGALNATVGDGNWSIGWQTYRYNDAGYSVGGGTVYAESITAVELDWLLGSVKVIVSEDDAYVSISESGETPLAESAQVHWCVRADGTLEIRHRASGSFMASSLQEKELILRVPASMAQSFTDMDLLVVRGALLVQGITSEEIDIETRAASVTLDGCDWKELDIQAGRGDVRMTLPEDASFRLECTALRGELLSDFELQKVGEEYLHGTGGKEINVKANRGNVTLKKAQ